MSLPASWSAGSLGATWTRDRSTCDCRLPRLLGHLPRLQKVSSDNKPTGSTGRSKRLVAVLGHLVPAEPLPVLAESPSVSSTEGTLNQAGARRHLPQGLLSRAVGRVVS